MRIVRNNNSNMPDRCHRGITPRRGAAENKSATGLGAVPLLSRNLPSHSWHHHCCMTIADRRSTEAMPTGALATANLSVTAT
jgi:hypothetical protein